MLQFPEELLEAICSCFQPSLQEPYWNSGHDENKALASTLAAICRVNKACSRIATPLLYHTVDLFYRRSNMNAGSARPSAHEATLVPLLRTCLIRRDLALQIKRLRVDACGGQITRKGRKSRAERILPSEHYEPVLQDLSISTDLRLTLLSGLERDLEDASLSILFCLCQSLESLEYTPGRDGHHVLVGRTLLELGRKGFQYPFRRLRTLAFHPSDATQTKEFTYWADVTPFLHGSSVQTVKAFSFRAFPISHDKILVHTVTRLQLHQAQFQYSGAAEALFQCHPHLRHLQLTMTAARDDQYRLSIPSGLAAIANALRSHGSALESLLVVVSNTTMDSSYTILNIIENMLSGDRLAEKASLGDLRSLTKLRELTTTGMALLQDESDGALEDDGEDAGLSFSGSQKLHARLPTSLDTLRIVQSPEDLGRVGSADERDPESAYQADYWELLHEEILQVCCSGGRERLRLIEVEGSPTFEGDLDSIGWAIEKKGRSIVLTRS